MASAIQLGCVILSSLSLRLAGAELLACSLHHEPAAPPREAKKEPRPSWYRGSSRADRPLRGLGKGQVAVRHE
jgi:hypothetical protein